jgi:PAS domain S-box-containing protein
VEFIKPETRCVVDWHAIFRPILQHRYRTPDFAMTIQVGNAMQNTSSNKYKFSILVAIVFPCFTLFLLQDSEGDHDIWQYFAPLLAGGLVACLIGYFLDTYRISLNFTRKTTAPPRTASNEQRCPEPWFAALFEKNHSIILLFDAATGKIEEANPSASEFYGYSGEQLKQMHVAEITTEPRLNIIRQMAHIRTAEKHTAYSRHRLACGEERAVEVVSTRIVIDGRALLFSVVRDITRLKRLEGIIPICSHCKRIRDDKEWTPIEEYIQAHSEARFSHGLCPGCARKHYPTLYELHNIF